VAHSVDVSGRVDRKSDSPSNPGATRTASQSAGRVRGGMDRNAGRDRASRCAVAPNAAGGRNAVPGSQPDDLPHILRYFRDTGISGAYSSTPDSVAGTFR